MMMSPGISSKKKAKTWNKTQKFYLQQQFWKVCSFGQRVNPYWNLLASAVLYQQLHTKNEILKIEENANVRAICQNFCILTR